MTETTEISANQATRQARLFEVQLYLIATLPSGLIDQEHHGERLCQAVEGGVTAVQIRIKKGTTADRQRWLRLCRQWWGQRVLLIVNDDIDAVFDDEGLPLSDGLHMGRNDAAVFAPDTTPLLEQRETGLKQVRSLLGPSLLLGTSTRNSTEMALALRAGADHVGFGAMSDTTTKEKTTPARGEDLSDCIESFPKTPVFPIGGLSPSNLHLVTQQGCRRAAIGSGILNATDPRGAARACIERLQQQDSP